MYPPKVTMRNWMTRVWGSERGWHLRFSRTSVFMAGLLGLFLVAAKGFGFEWLSLADVPSSDGYYFILLAFSLHLRHLKAPSSLRKRIYRRVSSALGLVTACAALLSFICALLVPEVVASDSLPKGDSTAGMPHLVALVFILLGAALALPDEGENDQVHSAQILAVGAFVFSLIGMLAFAFGPTSYDTGFPIEALLFAALSLGVLFLHPDRGVVAEVFTGLSGGIMARRLLPGAILIPIVLDWWRYEGQQFGLMNSETGTMLMVIMAIILLLYEMIVTAQLLNRADASRRRTEEALAEANENLEARVAKRSEQLNKANERLRVELAERRLADEKLRQSERRLRLILDQIPAAVWTTDSDLRMISASGAGLAAAVINLSTVKDSADLPPEPRKALEEALKLTGNTVREIRTFSYLLHPPLLDVTGLPSALRWYEEGYSRRSGINVQLDLPENGHQVEKEVELTLFRIVQEALANIHRHSGGHQATIRLQQMDGSLVLAVADDGHGMDAQTLEKVQSEGAALGVGIAGMKERLRQLGGLLDVTSSGSGTTVTAALPHAEKKEETVENLDRR